jgi:hypothetical protein
MTPAWKCFALAMCISVAMAAAPGRPIAGKCPATYTCADGEQCQMLKLYCGRALCLHQPTCVPIGFEGCRSHTCPDKYHCELQQVQCFTTPCPPMPTCFENRVCGSAGRCQEGQHCELQKVVCKKNPCRPQPACVDN